MTGVAPGVRTPAERPPLRLDRASTLVDAIEEALKACLHEDGRWKLLVGTLTHGHWSAPEVSNRRAAAIWVAMALADQHKEETQGGS